MAGIALVLGSFFGFFGAVTGWLAFDMTLLAAVGIYFGTSLGLAALAIVAQLFSGRAPVEGELALN